MQVLPTYLEPGPGANHGEEPVQLQIKTEQDGHTWRLVFRGQVFALGAITYASGHQCVEDLGRVFRGANVKVESWPD